MKSKPLSQLELLVTKLDRELIARGAADIAIRSFDFTGGEDDPQRREIMTAVRRLYLKASAPEPELKHIETDDLVRLLVMKTLELNNERGIWGEDDRLDFFEFRDKRIINNAHSVAAICHKNDLSDSGEEFMVLKTKNYGDTFKLNRLEPFNWQPIAAGRLCTGFLAADDIIATAGHCVELMNGVSDLRVIFGFVMISPDESIVRIAKKNIYSGARLIGKSNCRASGCDWALIRLDRKTMGIEPVSISEAPVRLGQRVYILGHPCGLPLKYSAGAQVRGVSETFFAADLNVYCGNSGSPVFCQDTHEVVGVAVRGDHQDFRWTGNDWISIIYSYKSVLFDEPQCTKASEFRTFL